MTLLKYLFLRGSRTRLFSHNVGDDFEDLHFPSGFKAIAGVLYIPLSSTTDDCVVFYRRNQIREVHWAGRPSLAGKIGRLEPRNSFKKWTEVMDGTSKAWSIEHSTVTLLSTEHLPMPLTPVPSRFGSNGSTALRQLHTGLEGKGDGHQRYPT